jgi:Carboxypeptidase regulatory-like domain
MRVALVGVVAVVFLVVAGSAAALNPQPFPPRVFGVVRDACTGVPVAGATVSLSSPTGARDPGPSQTGPAGGFTFEGVAAGVYSFAVAAPGYDPVGANPGPQQTPGAINPGPIQVTGDPGPISLPAGEAVSESIVASVLLAPATPGAACSVNPGPINLPAFSGVVRSAMTGLPILRASESLIPTSGEANPGPSQFGLLGLFAWGTIAAGNYSLTVAAPGYVPIGNPAGVNPGPAQVTKDPGPSQFSDGGSVAFNKTFDILLAPSR